MPSGPPLFAVGLLVSALVLAVLAVRVGRMIPAPGARAVTFLVVCSAFWSASHGALHLLPGHELLWAKISYIPAVISPAGFLLVALDYRSQLRFLTPVRLSLLAVIPALTILIAWTNDFHGLLWRVFAVERIGGLAYMRIRYGPYFYVNITFSYVVIGLASVLLLSTALRSSTLHRRQVLSMVAAVLLPWLANAVYILRLGPAPGLDLTSAAFAGSSGLLAVGMFLYRLFDVVPIAHDAVVGQIPDSVVVLDTDGRLLHSNPAAVEMFGASTFRTGVTPFIPLAGAFGSAELTAIRAPFNGEVTVERNGETRFLDLNVCALEVRKDRPVGRIFLFRDITARKREEQELIRSREATAAANQRLSAVNEDLTAALSRVKALAVEAEGANRLKSEFLAAMSHEIRTPLNAVLGAAQLLEDTGVREDQREYVHMIRSAGSALLSIINDILDLSKAEAGRIDLESAPFDVLDVVDTVTELQEEPAARRGLTIDVELPAVFHPWVTGDASRVRQVLLNLVSNAVKFTESGSVCIRVRRTETGLLRFEVADTGIGVPEAAQASLFEVFRQADASMTRRFGGTGLGLSICRRLVEFMGGNIGFSSRSGRGSTFWFELPLPETAAPAARGTSHLGDLSLRVRASAATENYLRHRLPAIGFDPGRIQDAGRAEIELEETETAGTRELVARFTGSGERVTIGFPLRADQLEARLSGLLKAATVAPEAEQKRKSAFPCRVLVAEDNLVNSRIVQAMLGKLGVDVEMVRTGVDAVRAASAGRFDLILMDLQMPEMDGIEATRCIRQEEATVGRQRTPIAALTANVLSDEREQCRAAGMDDFLTKPLDRRELERVLEHCNCTPGAAKSAAGPGGC